MNIKIKKFILQPESNERLNNLCGPLDENLKQLEYQLKIIINRNGCCFKLTGFSESIKIAIQTIQFLYAHTKDSYKTKNSNITPEQIDLAIKNFQTLKIPSKHIYDSAPNSVSSINILIKSTRKIIKPRTLNQAQYLANIFSHNITFGIGPSGTGKTYLAIAAAINLLERQKNQYIILSRPVIEAGEKLGFLPGNFYQKTDPYIRPLYDALYDILGYERMIQLTKKRVIEVIPLAYMRGRTLNNSVIILDESQNVTITQMKMFLTRIGFNSIIIVNGDITQIDLPSHQESGLKHAIKILSSINNISFNFFNTTDTVRHAIVSSIIDAYET